MELIPLSKTGLNNIFLFYSIEERGDLLTFFRSLSTYAEWYEHRRCTFLHFKVVSIKPLFISTIFMALSSLLRQSIGGETGCL